MSRSSQDQHEKEDPPVILAKWWIGKQGRGQGRREGEERYLSGSSGSAAGKVAEMSESGVGTMVDQKGAFAEEKKRRPLLRCSNSKLFRDLARCDAVPKSDSLGNPRLLP